jgi:hypothetical protein
MRTKSKHSKFKNTGILFELLTRQITADILSGKKDSKAKDILFKYFNESRELGKEWQIYNFLVNEQLNDSSKADRAIGIAMGEKEKLNRKKLAEEKYNLIKEIREAYPIDDFLKSSIKNYKAYASIYKVLENNHDDFNFKEVVQAREYLVETLLNKKPAPQQSTDELLEIYKKQNKDVKLLTYKLLVDGVNQKYDVLSSKQKSILREYINNISNTNKLKEYVVGEISSIKSEISMLTEKVDSKIIGIKLNEVVNQMDKMVVDKGIKDNHIVVLLMAHELINEVKGKL